VVSSAISSAFRQFHNLCRLLEGIVSQRAERAAGILRFDVNLRVRALGAPNLKGEP
jgi:hypothetical protein